MGKEVSGEFIPKQDMIDEILKDLQTAKEGAEHISGEEIADQIAADLSGAGDDLVERVLRQAEALQNTAVDDADLYRKTPAGEIDTEKKVDAQVIVDVAPDLMSARIRITPPENGGRGVTEDDILETLREKRIIKGIKFEYVYRLAHHTVYNRTFKIAQGMASVDGEDAKLLYRFEQAKWPTAFRSAEDYAQIECVSVKSGDLLCEIEPATPARNGWNILGKLLPGKEGKTLGDVAGSNTMQFNSALYATCDGLVSMQDDRINVYLAQTEQELDNRTVKFDGTVLVEGNVVNGSVIEAEGDIVVKGSVQNSQLISNGNIILGKGVTGNSIVNAKGSLHSYFIENARVRVGTDITTDVVMRADVSCGGTMRLSGKRENLLGGVCYIGGDLYAKNIGNSANIQTEIFLVGKEQIRKEREEMQERIAGCEESVEKLEKGLKQILEMNKGTKEEKKKLAIDILYAKKKLEKEIEERNIQLEEICARENATQGGKIVVTGKLYPNVNLNVDGVSFKNEKEQSYCTIIKYRSELLFSAAKGGAR